MKAKIIADVGTNTSGEELMGKVVDIVNLYEDWVMVDGRWW